MFLSCNICSDLLGNGNIFKEQSIEAIRDISFNYCGRFGRNYIRFLEKLKCDISYSFIVSLHIQENSLGEKKLHCFCGCHFVRRAINNNIYIAPRANGTYQEQLPQNRVLCMWWMTCQMPIEILQPLCASSSASLKRTPF